MFVIDRPGFDALLEAIAARGYALVGPTVRQGAVLYDAIRGSGDLAAGVREEASGGSCRLVPSESPALFGFVNGPRSLKHFLYPSRRLLWRAHGGSSDFQVETPAPDPPRYAFIGVRACDLAGVAMQDKIFLESGYVDPEYQARRERCLIVAVHCTAPGNACFCASTDTGPRARSGFDIALTEMIDERGHYFVAETGSEAGAEIMAEIPAREAAPEESASAGARVEEAAGKMGRRLDTKGLRELLMDNLEHPRWDAMEERCLACANCTMVCPTCFCSTVEDVTSLDGGTAERWRVWDSCFTMDFSYIHGGSVRKTAAARYRQWITHKLASWHDQFGASGCVGCGRCIAWCPVGIDITEEAAALRAGGPVKTPGEGD